MLDMIHRAVSFFWGCFLVQSIAYFNDPGMLFYDPATTPGASSTSFFLARGGRSGPQKAGWDHRLRFTEENRIIFEGWVKRMAGPPPPGGWGPDLKKKPASGQGSP